MKRHVRCVAVISTLDDPWMRRHRRDQHPNGTYQDSDRPTWELPGRSNGRGLVHRRGLPCPSRRLGAEHHPEDPDHGTAHVQRQRSGPAVGPLPIQGLRAGGQRRHPGGGAARAAQAHPPSHPPEAPRPDPRALVFPTSTGSVIHPDRVGKTFDRLLRAIGLRRIRFHDLRHSHATHLILAGVHPKVVSERLGHASVAFTLQVYGHVAPGLQASAARAVAALIEGGGPDIEP